ncbi:helix-turn-helix domain-containing protein [Roseibium algae]|uniref:Helix-turn-helix domain-containing protein n=1 Tax=Roseibium algae TaxID=3123038 RepID=A0ABU8TGI6_9HYPH
MSDLARSPKQIGNIIRSARKNRGMSQAELGNHAGLRQGTISHIESGSSGVKVDTLLAVLGALDLELRIAPRSKSTASNLDLEDLFE